MKKLLYTLCLCFSFYSAFSQNTSYRERLYYTCKVWGFAKYYHSEVSVCNVNWDSVLTHYLPAVKTAATMNDMNDVLKDMLVSAGPMALATTPPPAALPPELSHNLDYSWANDQLIRADVKTLLDTIHNNFRPHPVCWVQNNTSGNGGWLLLPHDSLMLDVNTFNNYPSETDRLLMFFKYWNLVRYFNPYNYVLDQSWDSTLYKDITTITDAMTAPQLDTALQKITTKLNDAHVEGLTYNYNSFYDHTYLPRLVLRYADNKYIVVKSGITGITVGDEIISVDGLTPTQWEDSLRPYISAGNQSVFRRYMCNYLLAGDIFTTMPVVYRDASNNNNTTTLTRNNYMFNQWFTDYYPNDTLANSKWTTLDCNIGYVHMGNLEQTDVTNMYNDLYNKPAIIFDIRNYPQGTAFTLAGLIYPDKRMFAHDTEPDMTYPGAFKWYEHYSGSANNPTDYKGKIILLMNQETQSQAEYSCMIFEAMPDVVKVGSQTAGADGNITYFKLTNDVMQTGFTTLGIFYPNNDSTQRIGIVPDSVVYPTQAGIRAGRDEVLEKAMQIGCKLSVQDAHIKSLVAKIYPNPANNVLNVELPPDESVTLTITDVTCRTLHQQNISQPFNKINITSLPKGLYLLNLQTQERQQTFKFIKE